MVQCFLKSINKYSGKSVPPTAVLHPSNPTPPLPLEFMYPLRISLCKGKNVQIYIFWFSTLLNERHHSHYLFCALLFSLNKVPWRSFHVGLVILFLKLYMPLYGCTDIYLKSPLLLDIWVGSNLLVLKIILPWITMADIASCVQVYL